MVISTAWLYKIPHSGGQTSGNADIAVVQIGSDYESFPLSTNQWVGCNGAVNTASYRLQAQWSTLSFAFALQSHTPPDLVVEWTVIADGATIYSGTAKPGDPFERLELDVFGVRDLQFTARTDSICGTADKGYAALVQGYVAAR
ncbi:hypothetical protein brsh051_19120 [Brooklawnia propionicigenes]|uniref:Uncharacterized protein n=2 Tax=Brooklawnia propionicigenes TaxID=3041175 RepID=A0AAN0K8M0_9ACTN|nr:hypothetical protein brsh051_19120 [Brooklawnia sp. SH051]